MILRRIVIGTCGCGAPMIAEGKTTDRAPTRIYCHATGAEVGRCTAPPK